MTAIAIFVKTPGLSPLKTRLAAGLGKWRAESWYRQAADAVAELALTAQSGPVYWAVAEAEKQVASAWPTLPLLEQGSGGLGERMSTVHARLTGIHGSALLLGADAPQVDPVWLQQARDWLEHPDPRLCIGPASDGGFWTIGANRALPPERWSAVRYSQANTLARFKAQMANLGDWLTLPTLTDLDTENDLPAVIAQLQALQSPTPKQQALLNWMSLATNTHQ
jgi:uncharacterized protein